ncbi:MAG: deoxyhypusine synthase [Archaeoglobi archaeon]|nr:MAG: deoxyhypusine synthase [Archaeoglobi archaeon]TDA29003.1 MAG: deoxyhypusine synthase [Archaeoglobi archaeon]
MIPTTPIEVKDRNFFDLLKSMSKTGFQGRKLGEAFEIWLEMLEEEKITILMGLAGAMVPAGMRRVISWLIRNRFIDVLVSTGANLFHDIHEALGFKHYIGSEFVNDVELFKEGIDRIYDIFAHEREFNQIDFMISQIFEETEGVLSSREIIERIAEKIRKVAKEDSIVISAYDVGVPIFCPAIADSSIGIGASLASRRCIVDTIKDVEELTEIVAKSGKTGVIYIGGGVPKNFIQQTEVVARLKNYEVAGHEYAIQITTDSPQFGGLSGCTFEEGISWGKISCRSKKVQVFVDATIALPILAHGLMNTKRRNFPKFSFDGGVSVSFS